MSGRLGSLKSVWRKSSTEPVFFYVFIDPETIAEVADDAGGLGRLIDVLRSLKQGCLMAETDRWRLKPELRATVEKISIQTERKMVEELLIQLWKKGPLIVMEGDDGEIPLIEFVIANAERDSIDLILSPKAVDPNPGRTWEICCLAAIHATKFSRARHNLGAGLSFQRSAVSGEELFEKCFRKLINQAQRIVIVDYALGEYYNNDQPLNLRRWVLWIDQNLRHPKDTTVVIRTVCDPSKHSSRALQKQVRDIRHEVDITLELDPVVSKDQLPHRRFLDADGCCLDIDRGIDICDATGQCRQVDITYANRPR